MVVGNSKRSVRGLLSSFVLFSFVSLPSAVLAQVTQTVTFDEYPLATATTTTVIDSEYETDGADNTSSPLPPGAGFSVTVTNPGGAITGDLTLYNTTTGTNGRDPDLEFSNTGNALIAQESGTGTNLNPQPDGSYFPDDVSEANMEFVFETPLSGLRFILVDVERETTYTFSDSVTGESVTIDADVLGTDPNPEAGDPPNTTDPDFDQGAACLLGDNQFCVMTFDITPALLGFPTATTFDTFAIDYALSGAIDGLVMTFPTGTWSGSVLQDTAGDGVGDSPIANTVITLYRDLDGDGILTAAEIAAQPSAPTTETDAAGDYAFTDVVAGDYIAVQTQPAGFTDVSEAEGGTDTDDASNPADNNQIAGTVEPGENDDGNNFVEELQAGGGICYGAAEGTEQFLVVDATTGAAHEIGVNALGVDQVEAIAWGPDPVTGERVLYAADAGDFGTIDITTGVFTLISTFGSGQVDVDGLHYDQSTGKFWGSNRLEDGNLDQLFEIDLTTGLAIPSTIVDIAASTSDGGTTLTDVDDISIDPTTGTFYAVANSGSAGGTLVTIDPSTGATTEIGDFGVNDIEGMSFDPSGNLFGSTGSPFGGGAPSELYSIDAATGLATNIGTITPPGGDPNEFQDVEALACLIDISYFGSWSGNVSEDTNGDGAGDTALDGETLTLYEDTNGNGIADPAEIAAQPSAPTTTTDADGNYEFLNLPPGELRCG